MTFLLKNLGVIACLISLCSFSQKQNIDLDLDPSPLVSITDRLPKISKDSTKTEITTHVDAMLKWMNQEHYKSNFAPILIYAEKGLSLAEKSKDANHIHNARAIIGNTLIRIKDTVNAKKLFLKTLKQAQKDNDSSLILKSKCNLANIYYFTESHKRKTIKIYLESVEIASRLKDTTKLFILHHNLTAAFNKLGEHDRSGYHLSETEVYLNQLGNPPHYRASHLHNHGRMLLLLKKPDEAISYFKQTIAICENTEFKDALIEGYAGYKEALEMKKDYKGVFDISKKLEIYDNENEIAKAQSVVESVSAKLKVESYKSQIKTKELEKQLLIEQADSKNILMLLFLGIGVFLILILGITYVSHKKRKSLVQNLKAKNKQYLIAKKESEEFAKTKTKFFATVSHELRTPLYGVIGLSSILLEDNELKKHEKDFKSLKFSANYLLALINDLLQMNKIENNSFTDEEIVFNLKDLTNTIVSSFEYIRLQHQNTIQIHIDKKVPALLKGNSVRLSQILMNLIGNACKFTEKGIVDINVKLLKQAEQIATLQFTIKDTGPGIEKNKLNQIFDEFTQIDSSSRKYQGTGLGLPIVKKLVSQAKGVIKVTSNLGEGTEFKFHLDISVASNKEVLSTSPILDYKPLENKHILIVEDNRINQTVTKRILQNSDVVCDIAENGEEAVNLVKQYAYDLVLMDINMPIKNGIDATKEIRTFNSFLPIIALTAVEIEEQKHKIYQCGMNDIILKPYDIDQFKKTIIANLCPKHKNELRKLA